MLSYIVTRGRETFIYLFLPMSSIVRVTKTFRASVKVVARRQRRSTPPPVKRRIASWEQFIIHQSKLGPDASFLQAYEAFSTLGSVDQMRKKWLRSHTSFC